jgi:hypothetical protein
VSAQTHLLLHQKHAASNEFLSTSVATRWGLHTWPLLISGTEHRPTHIYDGGDSPRQHSAKNISSQKRALLNTNFKSVLRWRRQWRQSQLAYVEVWRKYLVVRSAKLSVAARELACKEGELAVCRNLNSWQSGHSTTALRKSYGKSLFHLSLLVKDNKEVARCRHVKSILVHPKW